MYNLLIFPINIWSLEVGGIHVCFIDKETEALEVFHNLQRIIQMVSMKSCNSSTSVSRATLFSFELFDFAVWQHVKKSPHLFRLP